MKNTSLDSFEEIVFTKPSDIIINQIKTLITSGQLKPGDKLPSERKLSEKLMVSRSAVRDAIKKLEFYGVLKTHPQSGTIVAGIGPNALKGIISEILNVDGTDFKSLVETRVILELNAVRMAAERRTEENIQKIKEALDKYNNNLRQGKSTVEEDLLFHLEIAEATQNPVLKSLMMVITPDIIANFIKYNVCADDLIAERSEEHQSILDSIIKQDANAASTFMKNHLRDIIHFSEKEPS